MPLKSLITIAATISILLGCGEPYREEGRVYTEAANAAIKQYKLVNPNSVGAQIFWNDCGKEVTCLFLYQTQDPLLVESVAVNLIRTQSKIGHPGVKLTVYSSAHSEPKVLFREITIK